MAAKKGCCCLRTLISILVVLAILVGTAYCLYSFTSLSTYGITRFGDFELGSLADVKLKDLWGALQGLSKADEEQIVTDALNDGEGTSSYREIFGDGTSAGTSAAGAAFVLVNGVPQPINGENVELLLTQPVYFERREVLTCSEDFLGVLFEEILGGEGELAGALRALGPVDVAQLTIESEADYAVLTVVVKVDISSIVTEINAGLPSFFRLGEELYITSQTAFKVALSGEEAGRLIAVEGETGGIRLNQLNEELSATVFQAVTERAGESDSLPGELSELNAMFFGQFSDTVSHLGFAGVQDPSGELRPSASAVTDGALQLLTNVRESD